MRTLKLSQACKEAIPRGSSYGAPTLLETELAKRYKHSCHLIEVIRLVNSGTEATMRVPCAWLRGYTGRDRIVKFVGCYHGHSDALLGKAGSKICTFGVPDSPGASPRRSRKYDYFAVQ